MLWILLTLTAWATPDVTATLAGDGYYTIRIVPDLAWRSAELTVQGGETADLGPAQMDVPVVVDGWIESQQLLRVTLAVAGVDGKGRTWMLEVEPFRVPANTPVLTPKKRPWPFAKRAR
jgi:hypothetical protein|tara:strand:+ start:197 stop:553 length:357 start_codon:yes stop_codon:yes gene_type:complete